MMMSLTIPTATYTQHHSANTIATKDNAIVTRNGTPSTTRYHSKGVAMDTTEKGTTLVNVTFY